MFAVQNDDKKTLLEKVEENIENLINMKLIKKKEVTEHSKMVLNVEATPLGRATFKGILLIFYMLFSTFCDVQLGNIAFLYS